MSVIALIIIYSLITFVEFHAIIKEKSKKKNRKKKVLIYGTVIIIALTLDILLSIGIKVPSPSDPIKKIVFAILGK